VLTISAVPPLQPYLELHPLADRLKGCHAVSLAGSYRITLRLLITDKDIMLDIGSHDEGYCKIALISNNIFFKEVEI
jgi:hypothetical protein